MSKRLLSETTHFLVDKYWGQKSFSWVRLTTVFSHFDTLQRFQKHLSDHYPSFVKLGLLQQAQRTVTLPNGRGCSNSRPLSPYLDAKPDLFPHAGVGTLGTADLKTWGKRDAHCTWVLVLYLTVSTLPNSKNFNVDYPGMFWAQSLALEMFCLSSIPSNTLSFAAPEFSDRFQNKFGKASKCPNRFPETMFSTSNPMANNCSNIPKPTSKTFTLSEPIKQKRNAPRLNLQAA